jgi:prolyl-tRNA synthetase
LEEKIATVQDYGEFTKILKEKGGFIKAAWCGSPECEAKIKDETGATIRVLPFEQGEPAGNCVYCGKKAKKIAYFARSY